METNKRDKTIQLRVERQKALMVENLERTPIIQALCEKVGITPATHYRWYKEDSEYAKKVDDALRGGKELVSDVAESKIITAIKEGNIQAATFWLRNHRDDYRPHLEISGEMRHVREELTEQETELLCEALRLSGFSPDQILPRMAGGDSKNDNEHSHV